MITAASPVAEVGVWGNLLSAGLPGLGEARPDAECETSNGHQVASQTAPTSRCRASRWRVLLLLPHGSSRHLQRKGFRWERSVMKSSPPALVSAVASRFQLLSQVRSREGGRGSLDLSSLSHSAVCSTRKTCDRWSHFHFM